MFDSYIPPQLVGKDFCCYWWQCCPLLKNVWYWYV